MQSILHFLKLIRFGNLIIVVLIQFILFVQLLSPIEESSLRCLSPIDYALTSLSTILIAASGYIINDIFDEDIDAINKPNQRIVGRLISTRSSWMLYYIVVFIGFAVSLLVAISIDSIPLVLIYPAAVLLLYAYSKWFKKQGLVGNLIVSVFCAFVTGIIIFAERELLFYNGSEWDSQISHVLNILIAYMIFGFLTTLQREIIKDIEDLDGDKLAGCTTLPIQVGISRSNMIAIFIGCFTLICTLCWTWYMHVYNDGESLRSTTYLILFLVLPMAYTIWLQSKARTKITFSQSSKMLKMIMASGILYLLVL